MKKKCDVCGTLVECNGLGPSNAPKFTWLLKTLYSTSASVFHEASCNHDLHYSMYKFDKKKADSLFLLDMLSAIRKSNRNWLMKKWLKYQAFKFYYFVDKFGQESYNESQVECLKQLNLNSRKIK